MTDNIKTLREFIGISAEGDGNYPDEVAVAALAALDRLQARIVELEQRLFPEDCPPADQERDHLAEQCATLGRENDSLRAKLERAKEALLFLCRPVWRKRRERR